MYTKEQLKQLIFAKVIDNVTEEIDPEDMRQVLDAIVDEIYDTVPAAEPGTVSPFYFGPWFMQPFRAGDIAVSTSGKKLWRALQNFNSASEPTANNAYWKLVFDVTATTDAGDSLEQMAAELALLYAQVQYNTQRLDGLIIPENPAGTSWKTEPVIVVEGETIKAANIAVAEWSGVEMPQYPQGTIKVSVKPTGLFKRIDMVVGYEDSTYSVEEGIPSEYAPVQPPMPEGGLFATFILWTAQGASTDATQYEQLRARIEVIEANYLGKDTVDAVLNTSSINPIQNKPVALAIAELRALISDMGGSTPPADPEDVSWVADPVVTLDGTVIKFEQQIANWKGVERTFASTDMDTALVQGGGIPPEGKIRLDTVYGVFDGTEASVQWVTGRTGTHAVRSAIPVGALWARDVLWMHEGAIVGDVGYITKQEAEVMFASKGHNHHGVYAFSFHTHTTDDITVEGANLWFTEGRVLLTKLTGYVKQGTTRAVTAMDNFLMALGIIENRLDLLTTKVNTLEAGTGTAGGVDTVNNISPDANKNVTVTADNISAAPADTSFWGVGPHTVRTLFDALVAKFFLYLKKPTPGSLPTSGAWALDLTESREYSAGTLTGAVTVTVANIGTGIVQVVNFNCNGTATVTLPAYAVKLGTKEMATANGAFNQLVMRGGLTISGAQALYFQWVN